LPNCGVPSEKDIALLQAEKYAETPRRSWRLRRTTNELPSMAQGRHGGRDKADQKASMRAGRMEEKDKHDQKARRAQGRHGGK
jgi:hypothetical protein